MFKSKLFLVIVTAIVYWVLYSYVPYGMFLLLPVNLFVTFLHEFGHASFALITGGDVHEVYIQANGAGYAVTAGGWRPLILMGGYIGSALLGNLLLYVGLYKPKISIAATYVMIALLVFTALWWYSSLFTSVLLIAFGALLFWMTRKSKVNISRWLVVIGTASIIYIIMDYNSGPSSDLAKFTEIVPVFPKAVWAIVWLVIVVFITWRALKKSIVKS